VPFVWTKATSPGDLKVNISTIIMVISLSNDVIRACHLILLMDRTSLSYTDVNLAFE
jgi:hypothetical protein